MGSSLPLYRGNFRCLHNLFHMRGLNWPTAAGVILDRELCFIETASGLPNLQAYPPCLLAFSRC